MIIGAGPGGLAAAKVLAKNNKKVLVLEKNKVIGPKVCAGGLTTKDFELGIPKEVAEQFFNHLNIHTPFGESEITDKKDFIATVDRGRLGQFMQKAAENAGAEIQTARKADKIAKDYVVAGSEEYGFNHLIGADGSHSIVREFLGLKNDNMAAFHYKVPGQFPSIDLFLDANLFGSGYAWIFPHKSWTSIGCGADTKTLIPAEKLNENFRKWLKKQEIDVSQAQYEGWFINYNYQGHEFGNVFIVGDAAGFASGLTGEGMYFAMISGIEVAKKIINPDYQTPGLGEILKVKKKHELLLDTMNLNKTITQAEYDLLGILLKTRFLDHIFIEDLL